MNSVLIFNMRLYHDFTLKSTAMHTINRKQGACAAKDRAVYTIAEVSAPCFFFSSSRARLASLSRRTGEEKDGSLAILHVLLPMDRRAGGEGKRGREGGRERVRNKHEKNKDLERMKQEKLTIAALAPLCAPRVADQKVAVLAARVNANDLHAVVNLLAAHTDDALDVRRPVARVDAGRQRAC